MGENEIQTKEKHLQEESRKLSEITKENEQCQAKLHTFENKFANLEKELHEEKQLHLSTSKEIEIKTKELEETTKKHTETLKSLEQLEAEKNTLSESYESYKTV